MTAILQQERQKRPNCKLCGNSWPHSRNIQTNALHTQGADFMHIVQKHRSPMNVKQLLNYSRTDDCNFAVTVTRMCKLQIVWQLLAT